MADLTANAGATGATLADLQIELYSRGYDHLNQDAAGQARALRWINQAYAEVVLEELWPFRLITATGTSPLSIADLGSVLTVNSANGFHLEEVTEAETLRWGTGTGAPCVYYRDDLAVKTFPSGGSISVRYYAVAPALVAPTDLTIVPVRYADVIVDGAVRRAAKDRDNADAVTLAEAERQRGLELMRRQMMVSPRHQWQIAFGEDY